MKIVSLLITLTVFIFALQLGEKVPTAILDGKNGGYINGTAWSSKTLKGKVHLLLYADPDKKEAMSTLIDMLKSNRFANKLTTVAIINMKATWLPDFVIEKKLKSKQKELQHIRYVVDKSKYLVKRWHLKDNDTNILLFDKKGRLRYLHRGEIDQKELNKIIKLIQKNL